jgi:tRNA nucleotidyltransferase (CCA-adding enzyme)
MHAQSLAQSGIYLQIWANRQILAREKVDTTNSSPVLGVLRVIAPLMHQWAGQYLAGIAPSGSFAKATANKSGTDIDFFISISSSVSNTLKEIYNSLFTFLQNKGYIPSKQNVSINILVNGYSVDLVPAKRQDAQSADHSLYRRKADTWTKTNVNKHSNRSGGTRYAAIGKSSSASG